MVAVPSIPSVVSPSMLVMSSPGRGVKDVSVIADLAHFDFSPPNVDLVLIGGESGGQEEG